ncbi:uncharacterized protein LOC142904927 isoform X1 [Nelusetta ayraudi]|uniref:uncharacterized protein LOC142904927 isoform X1 n=1 Tax=Nelusetta ayraudi TaxID=303726 RepID=UPI003F6FD183
MTQQDCEGLQAQDGGPVLALRGRGDQPALLELDVFQMLLMVVALGLLAASALYWLAVCYSRSRETSRARSYESAVRRRSKASRESSIFYIYSNPLPVGLREEEQQEQQEQQEEQQQQQEQEEHRVQELPDPTLFYL